MKPGESYCIYCESQRPHEGTVDNTKLDRLARAFGEIRRRQLAGEPINLDEILPRG